jgi:hypothetical protein
VCKSTRVAPANSLVLVSDEGGGEIPVTMAQSIVASTSSCLAIGCNSEVDGETELILGPANEVDPHTEPEFQGKLDTPAHNVVVRSVLGERLLELRVSRAQTRISIWVNDSTEPDKIIIGVE